MGTLKLHSVQSGIQYYSRRITVVTDMDGTESETGIQSPTSEGSTKDGSLIIAPIQVIIPFDGSSDEDSDREEEQKRQVRQKKKKTSKSKQKQNNEPKADKTAMLTKAFGQAIRLINESKIREKQKERQEEIRKQALELKARRERAGSTRNPVIIHI